MGHQLHPLRLATAQRRAGLTQSDIIQTRIPQGFEGPGDLYEAAKELDRFFHRKVQRLGDVLAAILDVERLPIEARAGAGFAADKSGREKVHLQLDIAGAFALRATALGAVERKAARSVTAQARIGHLRVKLADVVEEAHVGGRRRTRRAADGRLIDFVNGLDRFVARKVRRRFPALHRRFHRGQKAFANERAFAGTAHAGDQYEPVERETDGKILEVVFAGVAKRKKGRALDGSAFAARGETFLLPQATAGDG